VTFDDGYADNAASALPILLKHGIRATFFVATQFLDGGRMWNDTVIETVRRAPGNVLDARNFGFDLFDIGTPSRRRQTIESLLEHWKYLPPGEREACVQRFSSAIGGELPADLMMTTDQVRKLHTSGMDVGAHTVTHPILASVDPEKARLEIGNSKQALEIATGAPVKLFAYPNGQPGRDYGADHVRIVRELGFDAAVSTAAGVATRDSDYWQLPRFTPWDKTPGRFLMRLMLNTFNTTASRV
jgi:peptidoglycan/xylan/chitin deacetylase (PgdA/CDA1 family)